ncbi:MAG: hypothetical protein R3E89_09195 [Thiolinea sp.]
MTLQSDTSGLLENLLAALSTQGWAVIPAAFPAEQVTALRTQALAAWQAGDFHSAAIGRGQKNHQCGHPG